MRRLVWVLGVLGACSSPAEIVGATDGTGTGEPLPEVAAPVFVDPAGAMITIPVTRSTDLSLQVSSITLGATTVLIDGRDVGPLGSEDPRGTLDSERLTLRLRGAMVPGRHRLQLRTPSADGPQTSKEVEVVLEAQAAPSVVVSVPEPPLLEGTALVAAGAGPEGVLLVVDPREADPVVHVARAEGSGWALDMMQVMTIPVAGYVPGPADGGPAVTGGIDLGADPEDPADDRLRLAWRVGFPGERIDLVDTPWDAAAFSPRAVATLSSDLVGSAEYAELGAPLLLGRTLVVPLHRPLDVEAQRPGDHLLLTLSLHGAMPSPPRISQVAGTNDIDHLGPAIDLAALGVSSAHSFSARVAGVQPVVVEIDRVSGATSLGTNGFDSVELTELRSNLVSILGAFGSRMVAGVVSETLLLLHVEDHGSEGPVDASPAAASWEDLDLGNRAIAGGVLGGASVFLVPMGPDHPVAAIVSTAATPSVQALDLFCDELALPAALATDGSLAVACRLGQEIRVGTLGIELDQ